MKRKQADCVDGGIHQDDRRKLTAKMETLWGQGRRTKIEAGPLQRAGGMPKDQSRK